MIGAIFGSSGGIEAARTEPGSALDRMAVALRRRTPIVRRVDAGGAVLAGERPVRAGALALVVAGAPLDGAKRVATEELADRIATRGFVEAIGALRGAFAIAAFDGATRRLFLARDPTGQRALYVAKVGGGIAFASEPKALFARGDVPIDVDLLALARYLATAYLPGEATLVRAIREVPPGMALAFEGADEVLRTVLWRPREPADLPRGDVDVAPFATRLRATLDDTIAAYEAASAHLGPAAAFLSGGIDSSLVVALASRVAPPPVCFSITFGDDLPNEIAFSSLVARHVGAEHHVVELRPDAIAGALEETIFELDDPIGDPLTVPNYLVARAAAKAGFRRTWNGEGGDPCFGGPKNVPMLLAELYDDGDDPLARERAYLRAYQKLYDDLPRLFVPDVLARATEREPVEALFSPFFAEEGSFLNKLQLLNLVFKGGSHILVKVEKMAGAHGLVPLSPLFDRDVADRAWETPPAWKLRGNVEKFVLKEAVKDVVPDEIVKRKKSGMLVPVHPWFQGPLRALADELLSPEATKRRGLFQPAFVDELRGYRGAATTRGFYGAKLWLLLTLEVWMRLFVDGGARTRFVGEARWEAVR